MSKITKNHRRQRRARKARAKIREQGKARLAVFRSSKHIYAQIIDDQQGHTLASASTVDTELAKDLTQSGNVEAAKKVGATLAERAKQAGVGDVAFDRGGFQYHGRVKALAEAARENGLKF
ncbi:50S ribosomal protein L18 [Thiohalorhabdus denitrificans]|uniref:Large ribosomal subunit protein uL18 n=1 Tax=Thiohalorhabdus denitrificans TaxID=381306 RepID=A0A0P9C7Q7_9GAMM|nr:50S ribosomal protein L18 [Thiohalorhabdus denitrificans]KPV40970.1 50S ribosomal protein L18 [Thiohalorhabdus denitrificans]SCY43055.1 LSU ribosomal protein L18P [Thiohalorhabdus denitrificans]